MKIIYPLARLKFGSYGQLFHVFGPHQHGIADEEAFELVLMHTKALQL